MFPIVVHHLFFHVFGFNLATGFILKHVFEARSHPSEVERDNDTRDKCYREKPDVGTYYSS